MILPEVMSEEEELQALIAAFRALPAEDLTMFENTRPQRTPLIPLLAAGMMTHHDTVFVLMQPSRPDAALMLTGTPEIAAFFMACRRYLQGKLREYPPMRTIEDES